MKKLLWISLMSNLAIAEAMYGTVDHPQINGGNFDVHQTYIEPNNGYHPDNLNSSAPSHDRYKVEVKTKPSVPVNFKSDSWVSDSKVERALKQAASEGKLGYVLEQAKQSNLPASVAILPIVESKYNTNAVSPKGAVGAWQLMQGTANDYGVSINDRTNFKLSTDAAIKLLNDLHQEFGNWALAFAGYNCGSQCVRTALSKSPNATDVDQLSLPKETKDYVHQIVRLNQIIAGLDNNK